MFRCLFKISFLFFVATFTFKQSERSGAHVSKREKKEKHLSVYVLIVLSGSSYAIYHMPYKPRLHLPLCPSLRMLLDQNKVLSSWDPGFRSYETSAFAAPVTQLWFCTAHENSHQIILTKHQHLVQGDTTTMHTHVFTYRRLTVLHMFPYLQWKT